MAGQEVDKNGGKENGTAESQEEEDPFKVANRYQLILFVWLARLLRTNRKDIVKEKHH